MDAVAALASIIGVAGTGAKIAITLFEVAQKIGSAGAEIRATGTEISLFCAVLRQLERTLSKLQSRRYSIGAIAITQEILDRCKEIFDELEGQLDDLHRLVEWKARLKWILGRRSKFQMHKATLESCKITLHIMLTTLTFAEVVASRRVSSTDTDLEDDSEELVATSLITAQQDSVERLEQIEKEFETLEGDILVDPVFPKAIAGSVRPEKGDQKARASVWLHSLGVAQLDNSSVRHSTVSISSNASHLSGLLAKWTDQGPRWHELENSSDGGHGVNGDQSPFSSYVSKMLPNDSPRSELLDLRDKIDHTSNAGPQIVEEPIIQAEHSSTPKGLGISPDTPTLQEPYLTDSPVILNLQTPTKARGRKAWARAAPKLSPLKVTLANTKELPGTPVPPTPTAPDFDTRQRMIASGFTDYKAYVGPETEKRPSPFNSARTTSTNIPVPLNSPLRNTTIRSKHHQAISMFVKAFCNFSIRFVISGTGALSFNKGDIIEINTQIRPLWDDPQSFRVQTIRWFDGRLLDGRRGWVPGVACVPLNSDRDGTYGEALSVHPISSNISFLEESLDEEFFKHLNDAIGKKLDWIAQPNGWYLQGTGTRYGGLPPWPSTDAKTALPIVGPRSPGLSPGVSFPKSLSEKDTVEDVLSWMMKKLDLKGKTDDYTLVVVYDDQSREMDASEKPLLVLKRLRSEGKSPSFEVGHTNSKDTPTSTWGDSIAQSFGAPGTPVEYKTPGSNYI